MTCRDLWRALDNQIEFERARERADRTKLVHMALKLKRKVATGLLTKYLPTILLLLISFVSTLFDKYLFGNVIAVNLTNHHVGDDHHLKQQDRGAAPHL